jgi:hypothetical protein
MKHRSTNPLKLLIVFVTFFSMLSAKAQTIHPAVLSAGPWGSSPNYFYINTKIPFSSAASPQVYITGYNYGDGNKAIKLTLGWYVWDNAFYWSQYKSDMGYRNPSRIRLGTYDDAGTTRVRIEIANDGSYWSSYFFSANDQTGAAGYYTGWSAAEGEMPSGTGNISTVQEHGGLVYRSNGNVGIGNTSPETQLHLRSSVPTIRLDGTGGLNATVGEINFQLTAGYDLASVKAVQSGPSWGYQSALTFSTKNTHEGGVLERLRIDYNGYIGIGTASPTEKLHLQAPSLNVGRASGGGNLGLLISNPEGTYNNKAGISLHSLVAGIGSAVAEIYVEGTSTSNAGGNLIFQTRRSNNTILESMRIDAQGNMGLGTASPTEKLSVNGNIRARKIIVSLANWSDYVFDDDYQLKSLSSVESFIKKNKHLPEIPSAKEVEEKGISIGDTQALLLKKIEELTLYLIEQEKKIKTLENKISGHRRK